MTDEIKNMVLLTAAFLPFHQGLVEVWKLFGVRTRRYWEALTYVVYGNESGPLVDENWRRSKVDVVKGFFVGIPTTFQHKYREDCRSGPQLRLIQSFLLRAVGDSPVPDVSDADIRNVADIARLSASKGVQQTSESLDELIRREIRNPQDARDILSAILATQDSCEDEKLKKVLKEWIQALEQQGEDVSPALFYVWRVQFVETFLRGVIRAERELANALKAAEFRYHRQLHSFSACLAAAEAIGINWGSVSDMKNLGVRIAGALFGFGALMLGAQAGKSLLDAIVGIGARLKK